MNTRMDRIGAGGLVITVAVAIAMVVHLNGQASQVSGDFRNAVTAEVLNAQGAVLLRGTFAAVGGDNDDEVERQATLTSTEAGAAATGDAEVEDQKHQPNLQEVEFNVTGVPARAVLTLVLDGTTVLSATANDKGEVDAEVQVSVAQRP